MLGLAAALEGATGLVLMIDPALVACVFLARAFSGRGRR